MASLGPSVDSTGLSLSRRLDQVAVRNFRSSLVHSFAQENAVLSSGIHRAVYLWFE